MHVKPHVAACYYFTAVAAMLSTSVWMIAGMTDLPELFKYSSTAPHCGFTLHGMGLGLSFWRHGPGVVESRLYDASIVLNSFLPVPTDVVGSLGPLDAVPFHNKIYYVWFTCFLTFCASHIMAAGGSKGEHPLQPRTSIFWPFIRGTIHAIQLMDAVTDLAVIKTLFKQACALISFLSHIHCSGFRNSG